MPDRLNIVKRYHGYHRAPPRTAKWSVEKDQFPSVSREMRKGVCGRGIEGERYKGGGGGGSGNVFCPETSLTSATGGKRGVSTVSSFDQNLTEKRHRPRRAGGERYRYLSQGEEMGGESPPSLMAACTLGVGVGGPRHGPHAIFTPPHSPAPHPHGNGGARVGESRRLGLEPTPRGPRHLPPTVLPPGGGVRWTGRERASERAGGRVRALAGGGGLATRS